MGFLLRLHDKEQLRSLFRARSLTSWQEEASPWPWPPFIVLAFFLPAKWAEGAGKPSTPKIHPMLILGFDQGCVGTEKGRRRRGKQRGLNLWTFSTRWKFPGQKDTDPSPGHSPPGPAPRPGLEPRGGLRPRKAVFRTPVSGAWESRGLGLLVRASTNVLFSLWPHRRGNGKVWRITSPS